jgi:hypothetical protein
MGLLTLLIVASLVLPSRSGSSGGDGPTSWLAVVLPLVLAVPAHELLHALLYPDHGLSRATVLVVWPRKLRAGVYFEGCMSRERWLLMRMAPLVILAIVPALLLVGTAGISLTPLQTSLSMLLLVNAVGSGNDVLGALWDASNIPKRSTLGFLGGKAYWKAG